MTHASAFLVRQTFLTIVGEGILLFIVLAMQLVFPWIGKPVSKKRWLLLSAVCATMAVVIASAFALRR